MQFFLKSTEASDPTRRVGPLGPGLDVRLRGLSARQHRILLHGALIGILALYVLLRLWRLHAYSLWYDEVFSVLVARSSWKELFWQVLLDRVHPPLFYALLKLWVGAFGDGLGTLRLFSVFFSTVAIVPLWSCMKRIGLFRQLSLALLLAIACNPFLIFYSQEVRMYALLGFLSILSVDLYLKQEENGSSRSPLLALVNLSLVLVHVAGAAVVGFEFLHSMLTGGKLRSRALQLALPAFGALLLWFIAIRLLVPHASAVAHNVSWIPRPTVMIEWKVLTHLLGGQMAVLALNFPIVIAPWLSHSPLKGYTRLLLSLSIATIGVVFAFSLIIRPVWQERYLIISVLPYYLLAGESIGKLPRKWSFACAIGVVIAAMLSLEYDLTHLSDRPKFGAFSAICHDLAQPLIASDDIVAAPLSFALNSNARAVEVVKSVSLSAPGELNFRVRDIAYSVGQRDSIDSAHSVHAREFLYAYDAASDVELARGVSPSDFQALGCRIQQLAETRGQGHHFALFHVSCLTAK